MSSSPDPRSRTAGIGTRQPSGIDSSAAATASGTESQAPPTARLHEDLSPTKIGASALTAVTAALVASKIGPGGTLVGAAVGAVVSTVATVIYTRSLDRASQNLRRTRAAAIRRAQLGMAPESAPAEAEAPLEPTDRRWGRRAAIAGAGFVIAVGAITGAEALLGHPVSGGSGGSTLGDVTGRTTTRQSTDRQSTPAATATSPVATSPAVTTSTAEPSGSTDATTSPTATSSAESSSSSPTNSATTSSTEPTTQPTASGQLSASAAATG